MKEIKNKIVEFIKPTIWKIVLFLVVFYASTVPTMAEGIRVGNQTTSGFPFQFYSGESSIAMSTATHSYDWIALAGDIIVWYLVTCLVIFIYNIFKKHLRGKKSKAQ